MPTAVRNDLWVAFNVPGERAAADPDQPTPPRPPFASARPPAAGETGIGSSPGDHWGVTPGPSQRRTSLSLRSIKVRTTYSAARGSE